MGLNLPSNYKIVTSDNKFFNTPNQIKFIKNIMISNI